MYKHIGPPVWREEESRKFLEKHLTSGDTVAGPRVEGDRWIVDKRRSHTEATELLAARMRNGGRDIGIAAKISFSTKSGFDIILNDKIAEAYEENDDFARALTEYLRGRPFWLG